MHHQTCPQSFSTLPKGRPEDFDALVPFKKGKRQIRCCCSSGGECSETMRRGRQLYLLRGAGRAAEAAFFAAEGTWQSACDAAMSAAVQWIHAYNGQYKPYLFVETEARKARLKANNKNRNLASDMDGRKRMKVEGGGAGGEGSAGAPTSGQAAGAGVTAACAPEVPAGGAVAMVAAGEAARRNPRTSDAVRSVAMRGRGGSRLAGRRRLLRIGARLAVRWRVDASAARDGWWQPAPVRMGGRAPARPTFTVC